MDDDLYDEFGNLIGEPKDNSSDSDSEYEVPVFNFQQQQQQQQQQPDSDDEDEKDVDMEVQRQQHQNTIVLHEDKQHYSTITDVFGPDVETVIATSDALDINEPIVQPQLDKTFKIEEKDLPETLYSKEYMHDLSNLPSKVRNIALCGSLHSGKTSFLDMLINETHNLQTSRNLKNYKPLRYTDNHKLEINRGISIKATTMTLLLSNLKGNSTVCNVIDSPGHVNFVDELAVATRLADTMAIVVDVVEGLTKGLEICIDHALRTNTSICLILNKIDRLILELRLPPLDAYFKIRKVIEDVNDFIQNSKFFQKGTYTYESRISPEIGNVCFSSSSLNFCFSLRSFSQMYIESHQISKISVNSFATKLWGDIYYIDKKFTTKPSNLASASASRTFVKFILDPIYKLVSHTLTKEPKELQAFLKEALNITSIHKSKYKMDMQLLLKEVSVAFLGNCATAFTDMVERQPSPEENALSKFQSIYTGSLDDPTISQIISECNPEGPLIAYVAKLVDTKDAQRFYAQVRVLSGTLKPSTSVQLLGEHYSDNYDEDIKDQDIKRTFLSGARYRIPVNGIHAGSIGLISGHNIDTFISETATIYDEAFRGQKLYIFKPLERISKPVYKVAVQPANPSELSKFIEGLRKLNRSYIGSEIKVEEGGDHVILGYGELYLDCLLHDLRYLYTDLEIKVSDPMTKFSETCVDMSMVKLTVESNNKKNRITILAESMDERIGKDIENGLVSIQQPARQLAKHFKTVYKWDALAARSIWAFGPEDSNGTSILCDDTLPDEVDKKRLLSVKDAIKQGFKWATREGPLCDEPIRDVKFRIIDVELSNNYLEANGAQLIQMVRKACYAALMTATPRLLEPVYEIEIICFSQIVKSLPKLLDKRRGSIVSDKPIDGTQLYKVTGFVPVIESVGLETDIRLLTQGQAMCQMVFSRWQVTPGDPLDSDVFIPRLKPAHVNALARDFTIKTRKRKGLDDEPSLKKYVDLETFEKLKAAGMFG